MRPPRKGAGPEREPRTGRVVAESGCEHSLETLPVEGHEPESWAPRLHRGWAEFEDSTRDTVEKALALGRDLIEAKAALPHGQFRRLFGDHADPVARPMPFSWSWAARLMKIASHPTLTDVKHASHLPSNIDAMAMLARLSEEEVEEAIETGRVTRNTTRREVASIVAQQREQLEANRKSIRQVMDTPEARAEIAAMEERVAKDAAREKDDSAVLKSLKFNWRRAGQRDRNKFLQWIKEVRR